MESKWSWYRILDNLRNVNLLGLLFFIPIGGRMMPPFIAMWLILWILDFRWKKKWRFFWNHKIILTSILFFGAYLLSLLITENKDSGIHQVETKLVFLIFPVLFGFNADYRWLNRNILKSVFIYGTVFAAIICTGNAIDNILVEKELVEMDLLKDAYVGLDYLFASRLSFLMHPSYLALYVTIAMYFIFTIVWKEKRRFIVYALIGVNLLLSVFIFILASRLGYLTMFLLWSGVAIAYVIRTNSYLKGALIFIGMFGVLITVYNTSEIVASRFDYAIRSFTSPTVDRTSSESSAVRRLVWSAATTEIAANPLTGVGCGDVEKTLMNRYQIEGMTGAYEHKLNAHSQFLQTFLGTGIFGFFTLLLMLFLLLWNAFKSRDQDLIVFLICVILNILVEAMFETQAGVMFFVFFLIALITVPKESAT